MEIKELLEIMLNNVNEGREATHGLIGYNGVVSIDQPEQVYRKPHTYITVDQYNEIRDAHDINTVLNRLNLAIEKLLVVTAEPVQQKFPIPNGYYVDDLKIPTYQEMRSLGYSEHVLKMQGWLKEQQLPSLAPAVPPFFKPFIGWVCSGCNQVWPKHDYLFTEGQFNTITPSEFRVQIVREFNRACVMGKPFAGIVQKYYQPISPNGLNEMEESVNKRLNEIYQQL